MITTTHACYQIFDYVGEMEKLCEGSKDQMEEFRTGIGIGIAVECESTSDWEAHQGHHLYRQMWLSA